MRHSKRATLFFGRDPDPQVGKITAVLLQLGFPQKNRAFDDTLSTPAGI
jgi:hypothetical protein